MFNSMVSHSYFLEDGDEVIIFDPSCGRKIANKIEAYIKSRREAKAEWNKAILIAGHSHMDHANNFYLSDVIGAEETHIYVHENGFQDGRVMNEPVATFESSVTETKKYHNPYRAFFPPYNFFMYPLVALDAVSPYLARKAFSAIGAVPWPGPVNGSVEPRPLKEEDMENIGLGDITLRGWRVDSKIIFPTPGHSPCSISLLWPERKALFISDADWIGNPALIFASLRECISSLGKMKELTEAGLVELLLPAHGLAKDGREEILSHLDFHIGRLEVMRNEVLYAYRSCGEERDVRKVADYLTRRSPLFRMLKLTNYPRLVIFVHNIVTLCLKEEGVW